MQRGPCLRHFIAGTCLWLATANAFGADVMEEGRAAYAAGDYAQAIEKWQALIAEGRPEGAFFLGVMYAGGKGVARDHAKAFDLYSDAAQKNYVPAQYNLGNQYAMGEGVGQDYAKAEFWWTKAAEGGLMPAQVNLATIYLHGVTGGKDPVRARRWLTLAAAQGSVPARELLAKLDAESAPSVPLAPPATPATAAATANTPRREAWALAQPANHYTLQILATGTDTVARDYIKQHGLSAQAAYFEGAAQGATVFRVIYGSYASRDQAEKALAALPRVLAGSSPWVRPFAEIHKLVDRRHADRGAAH
jgi:hypothetical protein